MKHVVVSKRLVELEARNTSNSHNLRMKARDAMGIINNLEGEIMHIDHKNLYELGKYGKGEEIKLSGAYLGMGLAHVYGILTGKGVKVTYHPSGCI